MHLDICVCLCICVCTRERKVHEGGVHGRACACRHMRVGSSLHRLKQEFLLTQNIPGLLASRKLLGIPVSWGGLLSCPSRTVIMHAYSLTWILGIQTQMLRLAWQALHSLSYFPSPPFLPLLWMPVDYLEWWKITIVILIDYMLKS